MIVKRLALVILVLPLLLAPVFVQKLNIPCVKASPGIYLGDLVLAGNDVYVIENERFDINGSIIVEENATLILRNAVVNFTQSSSFQFSMTFHNPLDGNPRLIAENATLDSNTGFFRLWLLGNSTAAMSELLATSKSQIYFYDSSSVLVSNSNAQGSITTAGSCLLSVSHSTVNDLRTFDDSNVDALNCTFSVVRASGSSEVTAANCTVNAFVSISTLSARFSATGLKAGFVDHWSFRLNCSVTVAVDGSAPSLILIDTQVEGWGFQVRGNSSATILESELSTLSSYDYAEVSLHDSSIETFALSGRDSSKGYLYNTIINELEAYDNSEFWLANSTSTTYSINQQSKVYVGWYLDVQVLDSTGQDVPLANVTATYPDSTLAKSRLTGSDAWVRLTLVEKMMNVTGDYPIGNYTVEATYEVYANETTVNMTRNQQATLILEDLIIPEFSSLIILPLFMTLTLLVAFLYNRRRFQ